MKEFIHVEGMMISVEDIKVVTTMELENGKYVARIELHDKSRYYTREYSNRNDVNVIVKSMYEDINKNTQSTSSHGLGH